MKGLKISREAAESLAIFILFLGIFDLYWLMEALSPRIVYVAYEDAFAYIGLHLLILYLCTESGFSKLKAILKVGFKTAFWLIIIVLGSLAVTAFFRLPPTTIIIILLLLLLAKK